MQGRQVFYFNDYRSSQKLGGPIGSQIRTGKKKVGEKAVQSLYDERNKDQNCVAYINYMHRLNSFCFECIKLKRALFCSITRT